MGRGGGQTGQLGGCCEPLTGGWARLEARGWGEVVAVQTETDRKITKMTPHVSTQMKIGTSVYF